ncbi:MAG: potassium-transporting ATPase subunit B, partial [Caulobacter sp.]|nr:potassium-transporting ATPase subunit B [Caulobacter sp.]
MTSIDIHAGEGRRALAGGLSGAVLARAAKEAFLKLDPRKLTGNPVIFATWLVALLSTVSAVAAVATHQAAGFAIQIAVWLWATVLFANLAESVAEGRGKAAADSLRATRVTTKAKLLVDPKTGTWIPTPAHKLGVGEVILVEAGDVIPTDGEIIEGMASVNEAAITGESAPVIRESGGDRSAVTGGTTVVSDWIKVRVTAEAGSTFLDRMIAMV